MEFVVLPERGCSVGDAFWMDQERADVWVRLFPLSAIIPAMSFGNGLSLTTLPL